MKTILSFLLLFLAFASQAQYIHQKQINGGLPGHVLGFKEGGQSKLLPYDSIGGKYTLPVASASVLGGVKVGQNLSIDNDGVLSAASLEPVQVTEAQASTLIGSNGLMPGRQYSITSNTHPAIETLVLTAVSTNSFSPKGEAKIYIPQRWVGYNYGLGYNSDYSTVMSYTASGQNRYANWRSGGMTQEMFDNWNAGDYVYDSLNNEWGYIYVWEGSKAIQNVYAGDFDPTMDYSTQYVGTNYHTLQRYNGLFYLFVDPAAFTMGQTPDVSAAFVLIPPALTNGYAIVNFSVSYDWAQKKTVVRQEGSVEANTQSRSLIADNSSLELIGGDPEFVNPTAQIYLNDAEASIFTHGGDYGTNKSMAFWHGNNGFTVRNIAGNMGYEFNMKSDSVLTYSIFDYNANTEAKDTLAMKPKLFTPANSSDPGGKVGDFAYDDNYIYFRRSTGWVRSSWSTF